MPGPLVACVGAGKGMGVGVKLVPPNAIPTPGPETAELANGQGCSKLLVNGSHPALRQGDKILMTSNPVPGPGAISGTMMASAEIMMGWPKLKIKGRPAGYLGSLLGLNGPGGTYNMPAGNILSVVQK